ncbi:MAG: amidohydrolase family protein [Bacteroidota bacterium]
MEIIDAHHHLWHYNPERYKWIDGTMGVLQQHYLPQQLQSVYEKNNVVGSVAVQANQSEQETKYLVAQAKEFSFIKGIVGWVDMLSEDFEKSLEQFQEFPIIKGFRHILQQEPKGFMLQQKFVDAISTMGSKGYVYDILVKHTQLVDVMGLVAQIPEEYPLVLDHIAKPNIKNRTFDQWERYMAKLSERPNIYVKLSGMVTEADWKSWKYRHLKPYMEKTLELFGANRVMFGSDWPVCLLAAEYEEVLGTVTQFVQSLTADERKQIMAETATEAYSLKEGNTGYSETFSTKNQKKY